MRLSRRLRREGLPRYQSRSRRKSTRDVPYRCVRRLNLHRKHANRYTVAAERIRNFDPIVWTRGDNGFPTRLPNPRRRSFSRSSFRESASGDIYEGGRQSLWMPILHPGTLWSDRASLYCGYSADLSARCARYHLDAQEGPCRDYRLMDRVIACNGSKLLQSR